MIYAAFKVTLKMFKYVHTWKWDDLLYILGPFPCISNSCQNIVNWTKLGTGNDQLAPDWIQTRNSQFSIVQGSYENLCFFHVF